MTANNVIESIQVRTYSDNSTLTVVVTPLIDLDLHFSYLFLDYLQTLIKSLEAGNEVFIDLDQVQYIASSGVGALSTSLVCCMKKQVCFYLCNLKPKVRSVFDLLGLTSYFTEKTPDVPKL